MGAQLLHTMNLTIESEDEFMKTNLTLIKLNLICDFRVLHIKDPVLDILYSVDEMQIFRMQQGFLSSSSIVLLNKFWFHEFELINTSINSSDSPLFFFTFQRCELSFLKKLSFIFTQNISLARGFIRAQKSILECLHERAINLSELTFTASGEEIDLQNLHRLKMLRNVTIYLNIWCNRNLRTSLISLISNLSEVQIKIYEFANYDDMNYQNNVMNDLSSMRSEMRNINPTIQIFECV